MRVYEMYDAGEIDATSSSHKVKLIKREAKSVLIYPKMDCFVSFNGSEKEIFIPANSWTPISITISDFSIRSIKDSGKVYWQAWYV